MRKKIGGEINRITWDAANINEEKENAQSNLESLSQKRYHVVVDEYQNKFEEGTEVLNNHPNHLGKEEGVRKTLKVIYIDPV